MNKKQTCHERRLILSANISIRQAEGWIHPFVSFRQWKEFTYSSNSSFAKHHRREQMKSHLEKLNYGKENLVLKGTGNLALRLHRFGSLKLKMKNQHPPSSVVLRTSVSQLTDDASAEWSWLGCAFSIRLSAPLANPGYKASYELWHDL